MFFISLFIHSSAYSFIHSFIYHIRIEYHLQGLVLTTARDGDTKDTALPWGDVQSITHNAVLATWPGCYRDTCPNLEDHGRFPEAVTLGSWWFGVVEAESVLWGWWQGRQEKLAGPDLQTLHGHSRESVLSSGGDEEAVKYSEQRSDRIRFLLQKQRSWQPRRGCNGVAEDQRRGDESATYYSNPGLSELRHSSWEWEDRTNSRETTELTFTGLADRWWVRSEAEKKRMTR